MVKIEVIGTLTDGGTQMYDMGPKATLCTLRRRLAKDNLIESTVYFKRPHRNVKYDKNIEKETKIESLQEGNRLKISLIKKYQRKIPEEDESEEEKASSSTEPIIKKHRFGENGATYEGSFDESKVYAKGKGKCIYPDKLKCEGNFSRGKLNGKGGEISYPDGATQQGVFLKGKLEGKGKIKYSKDLVYEGEFSNGVLHGRGKCTYPDGAVREGIWQFGSIHQGTITYADKTVYEGTFVGNKLHGKGRQKHPNGAVEDGYWRFGCFVGTEPI